MKKRKDGRYQVKITINGKQKFIYGNSIKEVYEKKERFLSQYAISGGNIDDKITVSAWALKWWESAKEGQTGHSSQSGYIQSMNIYIFPAIGHMKLKDVRNIHIQNLINEIGQNGKSQSLQKKVLITLNAMFIYAIRNGLINHNPAQYVQIYKVPIKQRNALTPLQCKILLEACQGKRAELAIHMGMFLGLRRGELIAAKWSDLDNKSKTININKAVEIISNKSVIKAPKTESGKRIIPIPNHLWEMLKNSPKASEYIVPSAKNTIMSETSFRRLLEPTQKKLDFPFTFHMLRHTYATNLEKLGVSPKMCQYLLGHATEQTTKSIYTHIQKDYILFSSSKINNLYDLI